MDVSFLLKFRHFFHITCLCLYINKNLKIFYNITKLLSYCRFPNSDRQNLVKDVPGPGTYEGINVSQNICIRFHRVSKIYNSILFQVSAGTQFTIGSKTANDQMFSIRETGQPGPGAYE